MRLLACLAFLLALGSPTHAQTVRTPLQQPSAVSGTLVTPVLATRGNLAVMMFVRRTAVPEREVWVCTSDGRALTWSPPQLLQTSATGPGPATVAAFGRHSSNLRIEGDSVHALWHLDAGTSSDVYYARSLDRGASWSAPVRVDNGHPMGAGQVTDWVLATSGDHVYVLTTTFLSSGGDYLYLTSSSDGGATFAAPVAVSPRNGTGADVHETSLAARGPTVHVAWNDDGGGAVEFDVYHVRSTDGGQTMGAVRQLDASPAGAGNAVDYLTLDLSGLQVFVTWTETLANPNVRELRGILSNDGGASFGAEFPIRAPGPWNPDVAWSRGVLAGGALQVVWGDTRSGTRDVFVATSTDHGATWNETRLSFLTGGLNPQLLVDEDDRANDTFAVVYTTPIGLAGDAVVAVTRDGGATWDDQIVVSPEPGDVDDAVGAFNGRYGNVITAFARADLTSPEYRTYVGGLRPQGLAFTDDAAGSTPMVELDGWDPIGSPRFCWVFGAGAPGFFPLPFGDGRDLGLRLDGIFNVTLNNPGFFLTALDPDGSGQTPSFPLPGPAGVTLYAAAVSFDLGSAGIAELSDVIELTIQ